MVARAFEGEALDGILDSIEVAANKVSVIPDEMVDAVLDSTIFARLDIDGIDTGERILASLLLQSIERGCMLTGDKRFVKALKADCADVWSEIADSIITLEMCLKTIHEKRGFEFIKERALPGRACDKTLMICLHSTSTEETFSNALNAYLFL